MDQVANVFKHLRTRKATGPDGISALLLKTCAGEFAPSWYPLFQISVDTHTVPHLRITFHIFLVPQKPCKKKKFRGCVRVEVAVLGCPS